MTTIEALEKEFRELKKRVDLAETRLSQVEGRFEFVSGQLRDIQLYQHTKFAEIDSRLDGIDSRLDGIDGRLDMLTEEVRALPRVIAELIAKR